ncbi:hypothetical protein GGTG_14382 [Gaeumannomyces tritici R3-111a-1]|uniref:Uncharacterized protein n=1 Tax=Gaeumannomyces tritici (strain R3-111a-1) TaxID=644352 RepID=J3PLC1_GAET3|nr:hypothetical protein GGTG_14382 [Gaeumannomyces tritici R3-111a-1]EJT68039.1 hypothetical protein GGTG_14382 [Gaeumannomyces tritici R3-111a-1]
MAQGPDAAASAPAGPSGDEASGKVAAMILPVLVLWMRTVKVTSSGAREAEHRPRRHGHYARVDGEGADGGRHVAAVARVVDQVVAHAQGGKGEVDVGALDRGGADDAGLGQARDAAAHAVQLPAVLRVRAADAGAEDGRPGGPVRWEVGLAEHDGPRRAAPVVGCLGASLGAAGGCVGAAAAAGAAAPRRCHGGRYQRSMERCRRSLC